MSAGDSARTVVAYSGGSLLYANLNTGAGLQPVGLGVNMYIAADAVYELRGHVPLAYYDTSGVWLRQAISIDSGAHIFYPWYTGATPVTSGYMSYSWMQILRPNMLPVGMHSFSWYADSQPGTGMWHPFDGDPMSGSYGPLALAITRVL